MNVRKLITLSIVIIGCLVFLAAKLAFNIASNNSSQGDQAEKVRLGDNQLTNSRSNEMNSATGSANADNIKSLEFAISNGEVTCLADNAEPGKVTADWQIWDKKNRDAHKNVEIISTSDAGQFVIRDKWLGSKIAKRPEIILTVHHHPDIEVSGSLGNGTIDIGSAKVSDLNLGNGTIKISGELLGNADVSLGNGQLTGELLIPDGKHGISLGNGSVELVVAEGSSFNLDSSVGIGNIVVNGAPSSRDWGFLGGSVTASIGEGSGALDISIGNGSAELRVQ